MTHTIATRKAERMRRDAALYLTHVERGESFAAIGRREGCAPSTVLRAVRRMEDRRDDPLFDAFFNEMGAAATRPPQSRHSKEFIVDQQSSAFMSKPEFDRACRRILRHMEEPKSFLLVAEGVEKAGVFSPSNQFAKPVAMVPRRLALALLSQDMIARQASQGAAAKYQITSAGRARLARLTGRDRERPAGLDGADVFALQHQIEGERREIDADTGKVTTRRINLGETPLGWLARRRSPDGSRFLTVPEVEAGERLREDFERAQIGPRVTQDWSRFLAPSDGAQGGRSPALGPADARRRFAAAMEALGPGLADAAMRSCCFLEGLEYTERRMGWSARSGKVVLKIALQRLVAHYGLEVHETRENQCDAA